MENATTLGERIRSRRMETKYARSQEALADAVGVSRETVSAWENDHQVPAGVNLLSLAKVLGVEPGVLLYGHELAEEQARAVRERLREGYSPDVEPPRTTGTIADEATAEHRSGHTITKVPDPDPDGSPAEQMMHMLGVRAGMRRIAGELTKKDIITVAYTIALEDRWPAEELRKLDQLRDQILADEED